MQKSSKNSVERLLAMAERFYLSGAKGFSSLHWRALLSIAIAAKVYRQIGAASKPWIYLARRSASNYSLATIHLLIQGNLWLSKRISRRKHEHNSNLHLIEGAPTYVSLTSKLSVTDVQASLAARAGELNHNIRLIKPSNAPITNDHVWGFWSDPIFSKRSNWQEQHGRSGR